MSASVANPGAGTPETVRWNLGSSIRTPGRWIPLLLAVIGLAGSPPMLMAETTIYVNRYFEVRDNGQPVKYVWNGDQRIARVTGSLSSNVRIQRLRVQPGWNLLSLAVTATNAFRQMTNSAPSTLGAQSIHRWQPATVSWLPVLADETLPASSVLWVHAFSNATLAVRGAYTDPTNRTVSSGASFQAGAGLEPFPLPDPAAGIALWHHDAASQSWRVQTPLLPGLEPDFPKFLIPGGAIFINPGAPAELEVPDARLRVRYYHPDHLGSSSAITDTGGALVEETAFYPFGTPRHEHRLQQVEEFYQFTQKERDRESRLHYFETRYLASHLARFTRLDHKYANFDSLSKDDIASLLSMPQKLNAYVYVGNNPLKYIDPKGEDATKPQNDGPPASLTLQDGDSQPVEIPIESVSQGQPDRGSTGSASGERDPNRPRSDFIVTRSMDRNSAELMKHFREGTPFKEATLTVRGSGTSKGEFFKVKLTDVFISGMSIHQAGGGKPPTESYVLSSKGIQMVHPKPPESPSPTRSPQDQVSRHVNPYAPPPKTDEERAVSDTARYFREILAGGSRK